MSRSILSGKVVGIVDNGIFWSLAEKMAEFGADVLYWTPWVSAYPRGHRMHIGEGFEEQGITRIRYLWDHIEDVDLFLFPDVLHADKFEYLRSKGKRCFGTGRVQEFELDRRKGKEIIRKAGLPVQHVEYVEGTTKLRERLEKLKNKYVKGNSDARGDFETFHHEDFDLTNAKKLPELEYSLGAFREQKEFLIEDPVDSIAHGLGCDAWTVDGLFPDPCPYGAEQKACCYLGAIVPYKDLPAGLREVNRKLSPVFKKYSYRGWWSNDTHITKDGKPYLIDPTCRCPSPPIEVYLEQISNWDEIAWYGSTGEMVPPEIVKQFGAQAFIKAMQGDKHEQPLKIDPKVRRWVKVNAAAKVNGTIYSLPQETESPETVLGSVVGIGDTSEAAEKACLEHAEGVKGFEITIETAGFRELREKIGEAQAKGVYWPEKVKK